MKDPWVKETLDGKFEVTNDGESPWYRSENFKNACDFAEVFKRFTTAFCKLKTFVETTSAECILLTDKIADDDI